MAQIAEHAEVAPTEHHGLGAFAFALEQPVGRKIGEHFIDAVVKDILLHAGELQEAVVAPQDLARVGAEDHHREWGREHRGLVGGGHIVGHIVDVLADALAALLRRVAEIPQEKRHRGGLTDGERNAHAQCDGGE